MHAEVCTHGSAVPSTPAGRELAVHWILRLGAVACFVGHGAFGIIGKAAWIPYFAVWGIPEAWAWWLMPVVGAVDISLGVLTLFRPLPAVMLWMAFWGVQTACLRPLAGEPIWELLERAGNFGVPLALLASAPWPRSPLALFSPLRPDGLGPGQERLVSWVLRVTTSALLIGHGGFGALMHKPEWTGYLGLVGVGPGSISQLSLVKAIGAFEIALGVAILVAPWRDLLLLAVVWKVGTEWLRVASGEPIWEFIERGGSYAAPLALLLLRGWPVPFRARRRPRPPPRLLAVPRGVHTVTSTHPGTETKRRTRV